MGLVSKFLSVGAATMASRVLGFVREALIAALLGAGPVADAFYAAFRFPNLFRRLFAEGAFNSAFVPLFASELETGGREAAKKFAEEILSSLLLILLVMSGLAIAFMPFLVGTIIAPGFKDNPGQFDLTAQLGRIMFPYLTAMSLVAMFSGVLNSFRRYFLAALAPVLLNVVLIAVLWGGFSTSLEEAALGRAMAWGVSLSGVLQVLLLIYGIHREGFPVALKWPRFSPPVRRLLVLAVPTAIAAGIAQINLLVGQIIASVQDGAISILNYADRLMQLPLGIIAVSIGVVLLPELTRALAGDDAAEARKLQDRSIEFGLGLMVPAAVGLFLIPEALIALIYERGAFTRDVTLVTAQVLAIFALGLPAVVLTKIFQPSYYSRQDTRTPMWFAGVNAASNILLAIVLFPRLGITGLAWAFSIASWVNALLLGGTLYLKGHYRPGKSTLRNTLLILLASFCMGAVIVLLRNQLGASLIDAALLPRVALVLCVIAAAAVVYFAIVIATGALPREPLMRMIRRRHG
ncbi:murein biosynthesis integral membrane protein MurJ [Salaquimonas pukyongi]|uniref:murein biosynthesis integral membrane protein MurJ n=1 Tax=Salaquimonas pukyongi TaxID=2712698 RepID=UPI00096BB77E|nr:murein biosynthesis integral membrane protein MurJ [Salaquimonas pukyongi]